MAEQDRSNEAKVVLDRLASVWHNPDMRLSHIVLALKRELAEDSARVDTTYAEMDKLRKQHDHFRALADEAKKQEARIRETLAILGPDNITQEDITDAVANEAFMATRMSDLRQQLLLWRTVYRVLSALDQPEAQVADILTMLGWLGINSSRQAIEAAVATHKDLFRIRKDGRKRFISLKVM